MDYSITDTYKMKREILNFSKKFSSHLSFPEAKFTADMTYGIVASKSCLLTQISQRLQENTKKRCTCSVAPQWAKKSFINAVVQNVDFSYPVL